MNVQSTEPRAAAVAILGGMAVLGLTDNFLPFVTERGSLWQFHLIRGALALLMLGVAARIAGAAIRPRRFWPVAGRSLFQAGAMLIYFGCLSVLPIGVVVAGLFTAPLFVLLISMIFQAKRVGPWRWTAVVLGFVGALLVIRPDPAALDPVAFLPILAGMFYAIGAVATRAWCEGEGTFTLSVGFFIMLVLMGLAGVSILPGGGTEGAAGFVRRGWMPLEPGLFVWIAVQAVGAMVGIYLVFRGYQQGEASQVAVFEYSLLVFASVWAFVIWGQATPPLAMLGMALIVLAGVIIVRRSEAA